MKQTKTRILNKSINIGAYHFDKGHTVEIIEYFSVTSKIKIWSPHLNRYVYVRMLNIHLE